MLDKHTLIKRQKNLVDAMDISALRNKFMELYGFETRQANMDNLRRRILYRLQEIQFGGLSPEEEAIFEERADNDPLARLNDMPKKKHQETPGTLFRREWKGNTYEVVVLGNRKFEYARETYRSLSAIAGKITGTHWNGRKFFGVK
jgi:hypothetical protein